MNLGLYVDAHPGVGPIAAAAEEAGFSHLWMYDSPLAFGDVYIACAEALQATSRLCVGPGVTYPQARPAHAAAQALATLSRIAPGRVMCGIGRGNSARHSLGAKPATQDEMFEFLETVHGLLEGETVELDGKPIRLLHPEGRWVDVSTHVPMWLSVFGPKARRARPRRRSTACSSAGSGRKGSPRCALVSEKSLPWVSSSPSIRSSPTPSSKPRRRAPLSARSSSRACAT
jgi:5,10-methylenetetrahydromethanopterin reductase